MTKIAIPEVKATKEFELPSTLSIPGINMQSCILFGLPKCGKTTLLSQLSNCLIIDTENGTDAVSAMIKKVPNNLGPVSKMKWLDDFADFLIVSGKPYDYIAIDSLSAVNDWAEWSGTYRYMVSVQGKKFNRDPEDDEVMLKPSDDNYQSVHDLAQGFGYRWSRNDVIRIFEKYKSVAKKCVLFVCHVEDKFMGFNENTDTLAPKQLALTGKLRNILPREVDGIGYVYNEDGVIKINFAGGEDKTGGNRYKHLRGFNDVADWNKIFI